MTSFISASACRGHAPEKISKPRIVRRPALIGQMLRDRTVPRFLIAPKGFGKTTLCIEYAQTIFDFQHVFWLDGSSPCFVRDLDNETLSSATFENDSRAQLVVIENIDRYDEVRSRKLSRLIDSYIEKRTEVIVCLEPKSDVYARLQSDRICLNAFDLLLTESEMTEQVSPDSRILYGFGAVNTETGSKDSLLAHIPGVAWGSMSAADLLKGFLSEKRSHDELFLSFVLTVFNKGNLSDLGLICRRSTLELVDGLGFDYPYFGINKKDDRFDTISLDIEEVFALYAREIDCVVAASMEETADSLIEKIADVVFMQGNEERACGLIQHYSSKQLAMAWLMGKNYALIAKGCFFPAHKLFESITKTGAMGAKNMINDAFELWRLAALGNVRLALAKAGRIVVRPNLEPETRLMAGYVIYRYGNLEERVRSRPYVLDALEQARLLLPDIDFKNAFMRADIKESFSRASAVSAALAVLAEEEWSGEKVYDLLEFVRCVSPTKDAYLLALSALFIHAATSGHLDVDPPQENYDALRFAISSVIEETDACDEGAENWCLLDALASLEALCAKVPLLAESFSLVLPPRLVTLRHSVFAQRERYFKDERDAEQKQYLDTLASSSGSKRALLNQNFMKPSSPYVFGEPAQNSAIPVLRVNLFGGFEVKIDDTPINGKAFKRNKSKIILALLVLNKGRDISKRRIASIIWPDLDVDTAVRNTYCIVSALRSALTLSDGSCPYLVREGDAFRLDVRYITSDVWEFEDFIHRLMFAEGTTLEWHEVYKEVETNYLGGLLPNETECEEINNLRHDFEQKTVDSLLSGSRRLLEAGEVQGALWFARDALKRDKSREDAYASLMEAQHASGQRSAAIGTFAECKKYLAEELGVDPSPQTLSVYERIIECDLQ